jgi:translation initiation factor IF-3
LSSEEDPPIALGSRSGPPTPRTRINQYINARQVRLIGEDESQLGVVTIEDARKRAQEVGLDLVEVASTADPPVCRIMDYGQFKYQQSKRQHQAKKHQKIIHLKEIKLRPRTEEHDFQFKLKHALEFVGEGDKVKVTVMFRGREMSHQDLGAKLLHKFAEQAGEVAAIEVPPKMEGRTMSLVLAPKKK